MIDFGHGVKLGTVSLLTAPTLRGWRNDYTIWRWCRQNDLISQGSHEDWVNNLKNRDDVKMYSIKSSNQIGSVGICGLTEIDRINQRAEFSLYIAPEYQQEGYGKAALKTLFSHGFMNQNLNVIWGETFDGNIAYDMFLKLGMKHEGTRRQFYFKEGKHIDAHLVSMTSHEFMGAPWKQSQL